MTHEMAFWFQTLLAVLARPALWLTALRQFVRLAPARWWTRPPYLPAPDADYVRFRLETAYGPNARPQVADVVRYLEWCRTARAARRG
jgi:hypothetical protein